MPRDAEPARKKPRPRRCRKCAEDLTGLTAEVDCPACGAEQPIDEGSHETNTVFQRIQGPPRFSYGIGKQWRPSAGDLPGIHPSHMTAEQYTHHQETTARVHRWCGRAFLLLSTVGFTFAARHYMHAQPWMGWTCGTIACASVSVLLVTLALRSDRDR